jgi:hypothetical protein
VVLGATVKLDVVVLVPILVSVALAAEVTEYTYVAAIPAPQPLLEAPLLASPP